MKKYLLFLVLIFIILVRFLSSKLNFKDGDNLRITSTVYSEPSISSSSQSFTVNDIRIILPRYPEIHYGDHIVVEGTIQGNVIQKASLVKFDMTTNLLVKFRRSLLNFYSKALPEPHGSLISGITIGAKQSLPYDFTQKLRNTGTSHIVVASGMNVTLTSEFLLSILIIFVSRKKAVFLTILSLWAYSFITSFEAPILRASIMLTFVLMGQYFGRLTDTFRILVLTFLIMLAINPFWIRDVGFILSFATTLTLIIFESKINNKLSFVPEIFRESLSTSFAAQIGSFPILLVVFHQFNLLSPLINALILWTVPIIMVISSVGGLIGLIIEPLGRLIIILCYPLTYWFISVVNIFA